MAKKRLFKPYDHKRNYWEYAIINPITRSLESIIVEIREDLNRPYGKKYMAYDPMYKGMIEVDIGKLSYCSKHFAKIGVA